MMLTAPLSLAAGLPTTPASLPIGPGPEARADGTARIVASILSYSRWPAAPSPVRLCVIGAADYAAQLDVSLPQGGRVEKRNYPAGATGLGSACDTIYIGKLAMPAMRQVTASVRGMAVVTIAEADPGCGSQAMFCLLQVPGSLSFRMNLDAVSRSTVRIDPRVLRMAQGY